MLQQQNNNRSSNPPSDNTRIDSRQLEGWDYRVGNRLLARRFRGHRNLRAAFQAGERGVFDLRTTQPLVHVASGLDDDHHLEDTITPPQDRVTTPSKRICNHRVQCNRESCALTQDKGKLNARDVCTLNVHWQRGGCRPFELVQDKAEAKHAAQMHDILPDAYQAALKYQKYLLSAAHHPEWTKDHDPIAHQTNLIQRVLELLKSSLVA